MQVYAESFAERWQVHPHLSSIPSGFLLSSQNATCRPASTCCHWLSQTFEILQCACIQMQHRLVDSTRSISRARFARDAQAQGPYIKSFCMHPGWAESVGARTAMGGLFKSMGNRIRSSEQASLWIVFSASVHHSRCARTDPNCEQRPECQLRLQLCIRRALTQLCGWHVK